jgi:hypothetical protein
MEIFFRVAGILKYLKKDKDKNIFRLLWGLASGFAPSAAHGHSSTVGWDVGSANLDRRRCKRRRPAFVRTDGPVRCRWDLTDLDFSRR